MTINDVGANLVILGRFLCSISELFAFFLCTGMHACSFCSKLDSCYEELLRFWNEMGGAAATALQKTITDPWELSNVGINRTMDEEFYPSFACPGSGVLFLLRCSFAPATGS